MEVTNVPPGGGFWEWIDGPDNSILSFDPDTNSFAPEITVSEVGDYTFVFTDYDCGLSNIVSVDVQVVNPTVEESIDEAVAEEAPAEDAVAEEASEEKAEESAAETDDASAESSDDEEAKE